jgi:hypothetical protein
VPQLLLPLQDAPHHSSQQQQQRRPRSAQAYYGSSGGGSDGRDLGPAADQSPGSSMQVRSGCMRACLCAAVWRMLSCCACSGKKQCTACNMLRGCGSW